MKGLFSDPITLVLGVVLLAVWYRLNDWAMDQLLPESPDEFSYAGALFFMLLVMVAIGGGIRIGIQAVFKI